MKYPQEILVILGRKTFQTKVIKKNENLTKTKNVRSAVNSI